MNIKTVTHLVALGLASPISAGYAADQPVDTCKNMKLSEKDATAIALKSKPADRQGTIFPAFKIAYER